MREGSAYLLKTSAAKCGGDRSHGVVAGAAAVHGRTPRRGVLRAMTASGGDCDLCRRVIWGSALQMTLVAALRDHQAARCFSRSPALVLAPPYHAERAAGERSAPVRLTCSFIVGGHAVQVTCSRSKSAAFGSHMERQLVAGRPPHDGNHRGMQTSGNTSVGVAAAVGSRAFAVCPVPDVRLQQSSVKQVVKRGSSPVTQHRPPGKPAEVGLPSFLPWPYAETTRCVPPMCWRCGEKERSGAVLPRFSLCVWTGRHPGRATDGWSCRVSFRRWTERRAGIRLSPTSIGPRAGRDIEDGSAAGHRDQGR